MDNTELHYLTYDPDAIYEEMQEAYIEAGGDVLYPGDEKEMLLRSFMSVMVQAFAGVDNALRMDTLRYAVGEYLDIYGEKRNCTRQLETAATAKVKIIFAASGRSGTLKAGTPCTADGERIYLFDEDIAYTGMYQEVEATVTCNTKGTAGNGLSEGTTMQTLSVYSGIESITCISGATGGMEEESDDDYRERIRTYGLANVTTGTKEAYERVAKEVSNLIIDAHAEKISAGNVGVYLLLSTETGATALVNAVKEALSSDKARPLTDNVTVAISAKKSYTLSVQCYADAKLTNDMTAAVNEYKEWQNTVIGRAFNPDMLISLLYRSGATRVVIKDESRFNGSATIEYTQIGSSECCAGTVSLAVVS